MSKTYPLPRRVEDIELPTAHSVRKLRVCDGCGGLGMAPNMLNLTHPKATGQFHGACVAQLLLPAEVLLLPRAEQSKLRMCDVSLELMRRIIDRHQSDER